MLGGKLDKLEDINEGAGAGARAGWVYYLSDLV